MTCAHPEDDRTVVEVQEQLRDFKGVTRRDFQEIGRETRSLNEQIVILEWAQKLGS